MKSIVLDCKRLYIIEVLVYSVTVPDSNSHRAQHVNNYVLMFYKA